MLVVNEEQDFRILQPPFQAWCVYLYAIIHVCCQNRGSWFPIQSLPIIQPMIHRQSGAFLWQHGKQTRQSALMLQTQTEGKQSRIRGAKMAFLGGEGPCTSASPHPHTGYVPKCPLILLALAPHSNAALPPLQLWNLHFKSRWADLNPQRLPLRPQSKGSSGNLATLFPQHDAALAHDIRRTTKLLPAPLLGCTPSLCPFSTRPNLNPQSRLDPTPTFAHSLCTTPISFLVGDFTAYTHWNDLSLFRDARRDVARCC